jgi:hypothetical protein
MFVARTMQIQQEPDARKCNSDSDLAGRELFPPPLHHASRFRNGVVGTLGVLCILVGVVLGILPIVPGFPLIAVGVLMLVASSEHSRQFINRSERRLPGSIRGLLRKIVRRNQSS